MSNLGLPCYRCGHDQEKPPALYYRIDPVEFYTKPSFIPNESLKTICQDCLIAFLFEREWMKFATCAICQCYCQKNETYRCSINDQIEIDRGNQSYQLIGQHPKLKKKDELCVQCFQHLLDTKVCQPVSARSERKNIDTIECQSCHQSYPAEFEGCSYGKGCGANVYDSHISCESRSSYCHEVMYDDLDSNKVMFVTERPAKLQYRSIICDQCIGQLMTDGLCHQKEKRSVKPMTWDGFEVWDTF